MKIHVAIAVVALVGTSASQVRGALPPKYETRPDVDRRIELRQQIPAPAAAVNRRAAAVQAQERVKSLVPEVRIREDRILQRPIYVTAPRFLSGPGGEGKGISPEQLNALPADDAHRPLKAFLNQHPNLFGHDARALDSARITRDSSTRNGLRTTVWEQVLDGIPVFEGVVISHITGNGELVSVVSQFVPSPAEAANRGTPGRAQLVSSPRVSARGAVVRAAASIDIELEEDAVSVAGPVQGSELLHTLRHSQLLGDNWANLVWVPLGEDALRLCWRVILTAGMPPARYLFLIDAQSGEIIVRRNMTVHATPATYNVFTSDSPSPMSPGHPTPQSAQPPLVERQLVSIGELSADASPDGWVSEVSNPRTTGNNADVYLDRNLDFLPDTARPMATDRVFDFQLSLANDPVTYSSASAVQLFYNANWYHDRLYDLGFDEQSGNFQNDNFGRGGLDGDAIICLVQAGADVGEADNAFYLPAPDGFQAYVAMFIWSGPMPARDGSLDQEIVFHELTHGLSDRLVGGGVGISALQSGGMGEGWSDFYALSLLSEPTDDPDAVYAAGAYAAYNIAGFSFDQNYYFGMRRYPYSTDLTKNPLTFKDIDPFQASPHADVPTSPVGGGPADEVHNQGEFWCMVLWEMRANIIRDLGWALGNERALKLVTEGMRLSPPNPTYIEAREAILQADQIHFLGEHYAHIWLAFAKRGLGFSADCPPSETTIGVIEAFDLPSDVNPDGILEVRINPPSGDVLFTGETNVILVRVSDTFGVTNATIEATVSTGESLVFVNDGTGPDEKADDPVYSATLLSPLNPTTITVTLIVTAPEKTNSTNVVSYIVMPPPPNDNFADAIKVPAFGTNVVTSNKRATREPDEPDHAAITTSIPSLWWNYTATTDTNLLIDAGGSLFRTVIAVYTNNNLASLQPVASAVGTASRLGPFVNVPVRAGVTYRIAATGYDEQSVGVLNLAFVPGGQPDVSPPQVAFTSPLNGTIVATNSVRVTGTAVDPSPNASGIRNVFITVAPASNPDKATTVELPPSALGPNNTNWFSIVGLAEGQNRIQASAIDFAGNRSAVAALEITYRPLDPPNDFFVNAIVLTNDTDVSSVSTLQATREAGEPHHAGIIGGKTAWWRFTPSVDGVLTLTTSNSTFDTVLAIYTGNSVNTLTEIASNDDAEFGVPGGYSRIVQAVKSNQTYHIVVDGYDGLSGVVFLSHSFVPGGLFTVTATGTAGGSVSPASIGVASNGVVTLTATPSSGFRFDRWEGSVLSFNNPLTLTVTQNLSLTAHFVPVPITDDFESGGLAHVPWVTGGSKPWTVQGNVVAGGQFAARSGSILHNQTSSLLFTGDFRSGTATFDYRVSSEPGFDILRLFLDNVLIHQWSGEVRWASYEFEVPAGTHTIEWRYTKDASGTAGLDAAFIDNVNLPLLVPLDPSSPPNLTLRRNPDGTWFIDLTGQVNQQYILQSSTNLVDWEDVSTHIAVGGVLHIPFSVNSSDTGRFYRAVASPQ